MQVQQLIKLINSYKRTIRFQSREMEKHHAETRARALQQASDGLDDTLSERQQLKLEVRKELFKENMKRLERAKTELMMELQ